MDNISLETSVHWLSEDSVEIKIGAYEKLAKKWDFSKKSHLTATVHDGRLGLHGDECCRLRAFCAVWAILASLRKI